MRVWIVVAALAAGAGCLHVTTAVVDGKRYDILGKDGRRWNAMVAAEPAPAYRCEYWRARNAEAHTVGHVELFGAWDVAQTRADAGLRAATAAREREVCPVTP